MSGAMVAGSTSSVQRRFAVKAREWQSSKDAVLNKIHSLLHPSASRPEGPAAPLVYNAPNLIRSASRDSHRMGWTSGGSSLMIASWCTGKQQQQSRRNSSLVRILHLHLGLLQLGHCNSDQKGLCCALIRKCLCKQGTPKGPFFFLLQTRRLCGWCNILIKAFTPLWPHYWPGPRVIACEGRCIYEQIGHCYNNASVRM